MRKAIIKGQIIFQWVSMQTKNTLQPFFEAMRGNYRHGQTIVVVLSEQHFFQTQHIGSVSKAFLCQSLTTVLHIILVGSGNRPTCEQKK